MTEREFSMLCKLIRTTDKILFISRLALIASIVYVARIGGELVIILLGVVLSYLWAMSFKEYKVRFVRRESVFLGRYGRIGVSEPFQVNAAIILVVYLMEVVLVLLAFNSSLYQMLNL